MAKKKTTVAREVLWPSDKNILVRVAFLYVGQGASAIVFFANGGGYDVWVVDINLDSTNGGIDVPRLVADLLEGQDLAAFANTHPHNDHLCGVSELSDKVTIKEVLHSGHIPSKKYGSKYEDLQKVIKKVKRRAAPKRSWREPGPLSPSARRSTTCSLRPARH